MKPNKTLNGSTLLLLTVLATSIANAQPVRFGNSYLNITKQTAGGTVEPGDILEIRTNYYINGGFQNISPGPTPTIYYVRYLNNLPSNTEYAPTNQFMGLITNEGLTVTQFTPGTGDDAGAFVLNPAAGSYQIRMNIGNSISSVTTTTNAITGGGRIPYTTFLPLLNNRTLITTAFRVRVTGNEGDIITLGAGQLRYKTTNSTSTSFQDSVINATRYQILISRNSPICADAIGTNFVEEQGGTFGIGTTQNRTGTPPPVPGYGLRVLSPSVSIDDGWYGIVNNLSPRRSTFVNARYQPNCGSLAATDPNACANRMFGGHWDIIGDHTGSTTAAGNPPAAAGQSGGYMLVVNSAYSTGVAYRQSISGLCPNTSYEFSLWMRNLCTNCGIDRNGTQTWQPGVLPNLTLEIDGVDRYSSGQVQPGGWVKKGFMFKTGPTQQAIDIAVRNNASGGGGNDWAIDDIALVTCNPNLTMLPSPTSTVCVGNQVEISALVSSFFDNYINYTWERSTNNGATWTNTGVTGIGNAQPNGNGQYSYEAIYPDFLANIAHNGHMFRIKVASTPGNINNASCSFLNSTTLQVLRVEDCALLTTKLLSFTGKLSGNRSNLTWTVENESDKAIYEVERSDDGIHFTGIATLPGTAPSDGKHHYAYTDQRPVAGPVYYRLKVKEAGSHTYSKIILLSSHLEFTLRTVINPFHNKLTFDLISPESGNAVVSLVDMYGRMVKQSKETITRGLNTVTVYSLEGLSKGVYTLRIQMGHRIINRQVLKMNRQ